MAVVQSLGNLTSLEPAWAATASYGSLRLYDSFTFDYQTIYRTQPNVRTCVDFLARNIAQLGLHVFRRVGDTDRVRLTNHGLAQVIKTPNPFTTRYRLIESLMADLGIWFNAYWLKVRPLTALRSAQDASLALLRIPPNLVTVYGGLVPSSYEINLATPLRVGPESVVHFRGYNADFSYVGLSPLETLRLVLAEEHMMGEYRENFWANSARMAAVIERPAEAPEWSEVARARFKAEFDALYAGTPNSGKTAVLEEGMVLKPSAFNAQESEYLGGRKLTREECARAYHIPLPMVGILDHATFSNIKEQHKNLYQDSLGPWLTMIQEELELQLLPEFEDTRGVYCEFNIAEKLQGSFEEQTQSLQAAVGRPYMTANEARARLNLPRLDGDADELVTPLNVMVGGVAPAMDADTDEVQPADADGGEKGEAAPRPYMHEAKRLDPTHGDLRDRHVAKWSQVLQRYFRRQYAAIQGRVREGAGIETVWIDGERWDSELADDLYRLSMATATVWAREVADQTELPVDPRRMENYVRGYADRSAKGINASTRDRVATALQAVAVAIALKDLYESFTTSRAPGIANSCVTAMANFGSQEGAKQSGLTTKVWIHGGAKEPRPDHLAMDGETVGIGDLFSNGMRWPGDPIGGAEENAWCHCSVAFE